MTPSVPQGGVSLLCISEQKAPRGDPARALSPVPQVRASPLLCSHQHSHNEAKCPQKEEKKRDHGEMNAVQCSPSGERPRPNPKLTATRLSPLLPIQTPGHCGHVQLASWSCLHLRGG